MKGPKNYFTLPAKYSPAIGELPVGDVLEPDFVPPGGVFWRGSWQNKELLYQSSTGIWLIKNPKLMAYFRAAQQLL